jgi:hypothetical protein
MNNNFFASVQRIVSEQGEGILAEPQRLKGWISDYAKDEPKAERLAFGRCIEYGAYTELKITPAEGRAALKERLAQKLHNEEGLDITLCAETLNLLETVTFGETVPEPSTTGDEWVTVAEQREAVVRGIPEPKILCQNCRKELQAGWKVCPYCGAQAADAHTAVLASAASSSPGAGYGIRLIEPPTASRPDVPRPIPPPVVNVVSQEDYEKKHEEKCREAEILKEKLTKTKKGLTAAVVIGFIALTVSIVIGVQQYNEAESELYYQYNQYNSLESEHKTLQSNYNDLAVKYPLVIKDIKVGNLNNGQWINRPGENLNASAIRFLNPVITYNAHVNREITLYIKVINPDGSLSTGQSSPSGYSYTMTGNISIGNDMTWDLGGWGNTNRSTYFRGNYRIEVWYEGICLGTTTVTLH